ncbi:MAG TPA: hypothetical protein VGG45_06955 [Terracidiphilus sp.]|jgi:hypothetical protein
MTTIWSKGGARGFVAAAAALVCLVLAGCGNNVKGHSYAAADGSVTIQFLSGGTANVTIGPIPATCTYTQSGSQVNLTCGGQTEIVKVNSDGSLDGPPDTVGHLARTK